MKINIPQRKRTSLVLKQILFAPAFFFIVNSIAQNAIPNPGFENWTTMGSYDEPNGWGTINQQVSQACFCKGTAVKSTASDAHSGSFAMKLKTLNVVLGIAPGIAATGTINTQTQQVDGGVPFNLRPVSLDGWYKYTPAGVDTAFITVSFSKWNTTTNQRDVVGFGEFSQTSTVGTYTQFSSTINYSLSIDPDTMMIILLSSSGGAPQTNSTFFVDDLAFTMGGTGIKVPVENFLFETFPNPAKNEIYLRGNFISGFNTYIRIFNSLGEKIAEYPLIENTFAIDLTNFSSGIYFYRISDSSLNPLKNGKFVVEK